MRIKFALFLLLFTALSPLSAEVMVLVHGYASDASTWQRHGVVDKLKKAGWQHTALRSPQLKHDSKVFYTIQLPAHESLFVQQRLLQQFLYQLRQRHVQDKLTLVGHSAGGVVARLSLLEGNLAAVSRLITIAAPHLGTPRAWQGFDVVNDVPFFCPGPGWNTMKSIVGGDAYDYLDDSQKALLDLMPVVSNRLLQWANQQPHPSIEYHSVVRRRDNVVPPSSQDMSILLGIGKMSALWISPVGHYLHPVDGDTILNILQYSDR